MIRQCMDLASTVREVSTTEYNLRHIPFTAKMMQKFLQRGGDYAVIEMHPGDIFTDGMIPQKGDCCCITEPFSKTYGWKDGMLVPHKLTYLSDGAERVYDGEYEDAEIEAEKFAAAGMREWESRFFIKVRSCRYRTLKTLKFSDTLHDNLYSLRPSHQVLLLTFDVMPKQTIIDRAKHIAWEKFLFEYM